MPLVTPPAPARPAPRARRRGRLAWLLLAGACLLGLAARPLRAQQAPAASLLRPEATMALPAPAAAVAISADESILAAATPEGAGRWRVLLFDRPSHNPLGLIEATVGAQPRLRFSPAADLLLIAGSESVQLWELPIGPLQPDKPLGTEHRRWAVKLAQAPGQARFGLPPDLVYWSQGPALYRRSVDTGLPYSGKPYWQPADGGPAIADFAFDPNSARMALIYRDSKQIGLLDLSQGVLQRSLQGHRFPVLAAHFFAQRPLLSLDAGNDLIQWQNDTQPVETTFLDQVPGDFHAATFTALGDRYLLLVAQDGQALAIAQRTAAPVAKLQAGGPRRIAVSPTGRYVLTAQGKTLRLYGFAQPASPLAYVRHLRSLKAYGLAQSYVRLMDDRGISDTLRSHLLSEASREPPGQALQTALQNLQVAVQAGDADHTRYWAQQVLALKPNQPDAVAALRHLRDQQEARTLDQARQALKLGQNREAISLANQIADDSQYYAEAVEVIRQAEARRNTETTLAQARERLDLGDYTAASALVQEVLRKEPGNRTAQALNDEIAERSGANERQLLAAAIGLGLACLLMGFVALRFRRRLGPVLKKLRLETDTVAPGPLGRGPARAHATLRTAAERRTPEPDRAPPRPQDARAARRRVVVSLIKETEDRLQHLRQADAFGQLTARLMDLEAELSAIQRRVTDPSAELGPLHNRLKAIARQVQALRVPPREREARQETAGRARPGAAQSLVDPAVDATLTHYEVLQLPPEATPEQIKAAYHKLLKQYHPDLHNTSQFDWVRAESERMSRRIAEAYHVLGDAAARARYDRELRNRQGPTR